MDCCFGGDANPEESEAKRQTARLDQSLKKQKEKDDEDIKLLLLGAGESGKSTIFKQMKIIHQTGYTEEERLGYKEVIHINIVQSMKWLINACRKLEIPINDSHQEIADRIAGAVFGNGYVLDPDVAADVKKLWTEDSGIASAFSRRSEFQLNDSSEYFFQAIDRMASPDYIPTEQDVLRARVRTTGIIEAEFDVNNYHFRMFDVGGQRNERRKWIHCFENVTAVMFCVGLSEYDQVLYEDENQNRMKESLLLFDEICNSRWFEKTSMILFLNKKDLFEEKISRVDLKVCFPDYTGGLDYKKGLMFIKNEFVKLNKSDTKQVYPHETCATDTSNVRFVFNAVKDIILQENLRGSGIL
eukprot:JP435857.1.p1 GENE.JP435857.1~~JP435857.1.p1  ORF type:complete len:357 (-),score=105.52 JP435857.1:93-1163(-)